METKQNQSEAWAAYLDDLQDLIRPHFTDDEWVKLFKGTDTPEQAAQKMRDLVVTRD